MSLTYYKRYRMEADLRRPWRRPELPSGYRYVAWAPDRLLDHAEAKHHSFAGELDSQVFGCLGDAAGCERLMREITGKPGFLPEATWLIEYAHPARPEGYREPVATVQGVRVTPRYGSIQNVGVTPWARSRGLGKALVQAALAGFCEVGLQRATLEVTAQNHAAVALYQSLGFRRVRTSYHAVAAEHASPRPTTAARRVTASGT